MSKFSKTSKARLETCHQDLQTIFHYVVKYFDCAIICGERTQEDQDKAVHEGFSKVKYPNSKHNSSPSMAVDVIPYPIDWTDTEGMRHFAGYVRGVARMLKDYGDISHELRWGGDWDGDFNMRDQTFIDLPHYELI